MELFYNPVKILFGRDCIKDLPPLLPRGKALIVSGCSSTRTLLEKHLLPVLACEKVVFDKAENNPSAQTTQQGIEICESEHCSFVIGFGGGSALDCAKTIAFLSGKNVKVLDVMHKRTAVTEKGLPFFAIPTTAGSGSEVTPYAILTDTDKKSKISIASPLSFPLCAIIDPILTLSMPSRLTASTGLDVLCHAVESAWSRTSNAVSESLAIESVRFVLEYLELAVKDGANNLARERMMLSSVLAGMAISSTGTTICHSISYPLTLSKGISHGFACAISLPAVMRYNAKAAEEVLNRIANACGLPNTEELIGQIEKLMKKVGAPIRLGEWGFAEKDLDWLTRDSYSKNAVRNPEPIEKENMREILKRML
jgi:alcohol dehydrogenase